MQDSQADEEENLTSNPLPVTVTSTDPEVPPVAKTKADLLKKLADKKRELLLNLYGDATTNFNI